MKVMQTAHSVQTELLQDYGQQLGWKRHCKKYKIYRIY